MVQFSFEWDDKKASVNKRRHGISFQDAQKVFVDPDRIIARDDAHSEHEERLFCIGKTPKGILTVRFTMRGHIIRIIGAANWRKWRKLYEKAR